MTVDQIEELGFTWDQLPSGNWNLCHRRPFIINGMVTIGAVRGIRLRTLFHRTKEAAAASIQSLEILD